MGLVLLTVEKTTVPCGGKGWQDETEVLCQKLGSREKDGQLAFSFSFNEGPQPMGWHCPD